MRLSNSGINKYLTCPRSYKLHYRDKIRSKYKGSALYFGGAIDQALNELLLGKGIEAAKSTFITAWSLGEDAASNKIPLQTNPFITYSDSDFDFDLLTKPDFATINAYRADMQLDVSSNMFDVINYVKAEKKENGISSIDPKIVSYYNLINWCVLKNKGQLMLEAYQEQVMPKFKRVVDVQRNVALTSNCGDVIDGIVDLVVELQDGSIALMDNKTASWDYGVDSVKISQQLTIYQIILNNLYHDGQNAYKIDKCGFAVIKKKPIKSVYKICKVCGHEGQGRHDTCDKTEGKVRCNGEWDKKTSFSFETQFIIDDITEKQEDIVLETINGVNAAITNDIFQPNMNSCISNYGKCAYFSMCHESNTSEYLKIEEK